MLTQVSSTNTSST